MTTNFEHSSLSPIAFQPINLSINIAMRRNSGVITGVEKTVVCMGYYSYSVARSIAVERGWWEV